MLSDQRGICVTHEFTAPYIVVFSCFSPATTALKHPISLSYAGSASPTAHACHYYLYSLSSSPLVFNAAVAASTFLSEDLCSVAGALSDWTLFDAYKLLSGLRHRLYSLLRSSVIGVHNGVWPLALDALIGQVGIYCWLSRMYAECSLCSDEVVDLQVPEGSPEASSHVCLPILCRLLICVLAVVSCWLFMTYSELNGFRHNH